MQPAHSKPSVTIATQGKSNLASWRTSPVRDANGNIICPCILPSAMAHSVNTLAGDPDRSNPTRSRMERPLDTIRSFEAAIDASYKRRSSAQHVPQGWLRTALTAINGS